MLADTRPPTCATVRTGPEQLQQTGQSSLNLLALWPPIQDADPDEEPPPLPIETVILAHDSAYVRTVC
eukprot:SAG31_NODE_47369_length_247_cov_3.770270_1_plen_67_part_10